MSPSETQQNRASSQRWNDELLTSVGFRRHANTSIFRHPSGIAVLSPGVGKGWFDIRQANLDKLGDSLAGLVLRFVPDGFAVIPAAELFPYLNENTMRLTKTGGPTYGFRKGRSEAGIIQLIASSDRAVSFTTAHLSLTAAADAVQSLLDRRPI